MHLFVRSDEGVSLLNGPFALSSELLRVACAAAKFSKDGSKLGLITSNAVVVYDTTNCKEFRTLPLAGVASFHFSPCATYIQSFQKSTFQEKNVGVWELKTGSPVLLLSQKLMNSSSWPALQFSDDETVACRLVTNSVHIYDGRDFSKGVVEQLRLPGLQAMRLSPSPPSYIATYVPEAKGQPAVVRIHDRSSPNTAEPLARRSFFKSSSVDMIWNHGSTAVLVLAFFEQSYKTYYGEFKLHYLRSDGTFEGAVPLSAEGPVHDAQWSPTGKEFIVVYGYMPAKVTLFDAMCKPLFEFGTGSFNTIKWNPFGTFICLAGFGNLPGDMAFWDRSSLKQMGSTKAACSVTCEWSPDGRLVLTATTAPRMNVDNGIKVFKYSGELLQEKKFAKLYQAEWQPGVFADRPASPKALTAERAKTAAAKPAAYRPPQASNMAAVRAQLFGEDEQSQKADGKTTSKSALKNKKRREKQKEKSEASADVVTETEENLVAVNLSEPPAQSSEDAEAKKLRALKKKLRQVEELKVKLSGQKPSQSQQEKLDQEPDLIAEIQKLEVQ